MSDEIKEILYLQNYVDKYKSDERAIIKGNRLTTPAMLDYLEVKDLLDYISNLQEENERLKGISYDPEETNDKWVEEESELKKVYRERNDYKSRIEKAIEAINTQLKNAEGGYKDNLRIIKFNLIKGSCTFEDLKTEEDYKYNGDKDE